MEPETWSIDVHVRFPGHAGDCTLPQRQLREIPLPSGAVVAIGTVRAGAGGRTHGSGEPGGQPGGGCRSLVVSTCKRQSAVEESGDRGPIVVKVASPLVWFAPSRRRGSTIVFFYDGCTVQYLAFPFGIYAAKLSSVSFPGVFTSGVLC